MAALSQPDTGHAADDGGEQLDPALIDASANAATELILRITNGVGTAPRISDPEIAYLISVAFSEDIGGRKSVEADMIGRIARLQGDARSVVRAYLLFGSTAFEDGNESARLRRSGENLLRYLDELAPAYDFLLRTGAQIARFAANSGEGRDTAQWRAAIAAEQFRIVSSVLACGTDPSIRTPWRAARLRVLSETASDFAALFYRKQALLLADRALAAASRENDSNLASQLKLIALAIAR